jgi:hypothetical protein
VEPRETEYGSAVYGSVLVAALVGAMYEQDASSRELTLSLAASVFVFWLAHVWSEVVGERVAAGRQFERSRLLQIARAEWPLVEAGLLPAAALALGWIGVFSHDTAAFVAMGIAIVQLVGWGVLAGRRVHVGWWRAIAAGAVDGALGLAIVSIEIALH